MNRHTLHRGGFPPRIVVDNPPELVEAARAFHEELRAYKPLTTNDCEASLRHGRRVRNASPELHRQVEREDVGLNGKSLTLGQLIRSFALALVAFCAIYFGAHFIVGVVS